MEVETAEHRTASQVESPDALKANLKSKNHAADAPNHSDENSNGPIENNNSSDDEAPTKTNGVISENECSDSKGSSDAQDSNDSAKGKTSANADVRNENNEEESEDSEEDDSSDDSSIDASTAQNTTAVSLNSDSEPETVDDSTRDDSENNDVVMVETNNEVHEINSDEDDDCVVTNDSGKSMNGGSGDSDVEMDEMAEDPLENNEIESAKPPPKPTENDSKHSKNGNSLVVVDPAAILAGNKAITIQPAKMNNTTPAQTMPDITIRGTTLSEVALNKSNLISQPQTNSAPLLPTLTDDMFVVEAPSFIVPYVYEKPSVKPFREFVDILGRELDEKRAKEEKERLEQEKLEKEKKKKEKEEKRARGEEVEDSEDEIEKKKTEVESQEKPDVPAESTKKTEKKKEKKRRKNDDDDASWDGDSGSDSEEQISEDDELTTVVIKDKDEDDIEEIKSIAQQMTADVIKSSESKIETFFDNNLGKFFINIGLNLVQEFVQTDLLRQQKRKLRKEAKYEKPQTSAIESAIKYLTQNLEVSKQQNESYKFDSKTCKFCSFRTESGIIMAHHLETPHMKNNIYSCNFCSYEVRSPHDILFHTEAEHNIRSRLERAPAYHQCANCPFEDNGKGKLARHLIACAKKFKPDQNLAPPPDWEPPAKIPKLSRARNTVANAYARIGNAPLGRPPTISAPNMPIMGRPRGQVTANKMLNNMIAGAPMLRGGVMIRPATAVTPLNYASQAHMNTSKSQQPSISITPLPRAPQPQPSRSQGSFVICEICDGYIKDLEQLRSHMQWIHKVKIHPKMIYNRPPLNCQKCQFRFFTDQGLERHLLGSHGLVTSSMQETANQGKDAGRCPVCGRVYQWKLLNHVAKDHNMTLKPAHLSYKCTVCTATFGMYKQFESHVYSAHSAVGKRMADGRPAGAAAAKGAAAAVAAAPGKAKV